MADETLYTSYDPDFDRFYHIVNEWMHGSVFIKKSLQEANITTYAGLARMLDNPDEINALKNRKGQDNEESIFKSKAERFRYCLSFVNDLQLEHGPTTEYGPVDITAHPLSEFDAYCAARPPFAVYTESLARAAKKDSTLKDAQIQSMVLANALTQAKIDALARSGTSSGTAPVTSPGTGNANPGSNPGATQPSVNPAHLALATLQRGVKLDQSNFPQLKTDAGWFDFHRKFGMHCDLHGFADVLNESFVPADAPTQALFNYQNKYLMVVMTSCIQTVKGKEIIAKHSDTKDAQKALSELNAHYTGAAHYRSRFTEHPPGLVGHVKSVWLARGVVE